MRRNSKRPNGVITAVFCLSSGLTGTCQYPFRRSILLKTVHPEILSEKSNILGRGYTSASVTRFSLRKSPHGLQVPSFLGTICRGEAQGEVDLCTIPSLSMTSNSFLAASNFAPSNLRNLEAMGGPLVLIWC